MLNINGQSKGNFKAKMIMRCMSLKQPCPSVKETLSKKTNTNLFKDLNTWQIHLTFNL